MSDPLSVAGSAVGIISLGIQVCQGLISSLQSFKGQDQDIQDSLNDVQTVISILYSLKGILPKVDERSSGTPAIRRCLAESEEKLREFQQFSLKLRGTQSTEHGVLKKMDHARRALLYPFREGKLKSLCQSLKALLQNLSLCLDITTLEIAVGIHTNVEDLGNAFKDQGTNVAKLSDQLQRLDNSMSAYYQDLKSEISRTQLFAQDFRQEVGGQLRLISTDVGSLMSINRRHQEDINQGFMKAFDELKEQNNFQKELIRTALVSHVAKISNDNANRIPLKGMDGMSIQNTGSRQATSLARARVSKQHYIEPSGCTCERQREYSTLSYRFWHATFEYEQHSLGQHARGCRYLGIDQPTKRIARVQLPFRLWSVSSRLFLTCIEYSLGTATPGMSIRYKSIVPLSHSPVYDVLEKLSDHIHRESTSATTDEISLWFSEAERAILSLYRDRESSPYDQDERGRSHALLALERTLFAINRTLSNYLAQSTLESLSLSAKRLIETLVSTVGDENGEMRSIFLRMILKNELRGLARFCLTTFNLDLPTIVLFVCREAAYRPKDLWPSLHGSEHIFELHPIMRAIFQESSSMLEIALSKSPEAVRERIGDVTTVELCSYWPEGLQKLLRTEAVDVLNEFALQIAVQADCIESADLLLKAGCPVDYGYTTDTIFNTASEQCMDVIASNLARRRSDLLSLAEQHQAICQGLVLTSNIPDDQASYICSCLDNSGISIPLALRVPSSYSTIYHFVGTSIYHYPILFKNGFTLLSAHNIYGLLPTMGRYCFNEPCWIMADHGKRKDGINWLKSQRIMDQTPTDPFNLGLNIQATSWHYLSRYGFHFNRRIRDLYLNDGLGVSVLDSCRCWCTPSGRGCTPLTTALKLYVEESNFPERSRLCEFFHKAIRDTTSSASCTTGCCIEVVQFLTFESLEMTHTCCEFTVIDRPDISAKKFSVLMNCKPERWQKIRSDQREQENAALLKTLMEEFIAYMIGMESSARCLEMFVNGYWRQRISEIFAVDADEIKDINNCLVGTKTYVLPDRARVLLGRDFKLIELHDLKSELTRVGETAHDEKVELGDEFFELFPC